MLRIDKLLLVFVYFIFITTFSQYEIKFQYVLIIPVLFLLFYFYKNLKFCVTDLIVILVLFVWLYGILLGLSLSNSIQGVISNFAGLSFYIFYFLFVALKIHPIELITTIIISSLIQLPFILLLTIYNFANSGFASFIDHDTSALRLYYSSGLYFHVVSIFLIIFKLHKIKCNKFLNVSLLISLIIIIFSGSKGIYAMILICAVYYFVYNTLRLFTFKTNLCFILFTLVSFIFLLSNIDLVLYFLEVIYNAETSSSHPRAIQAHYLVGDFNLWGKGAGATIKNYSRDSLGYGFELSFLNIIHKYGILSFFIFFSFLFPLFSSFYFSLFRNLLPYHFLPLVLVSYIIPSWGNPTLFTPSCVLLHCISLYLIRCLFIQKNYKFI